MILINDRTVEISSIRDYKGKDEVMLMLKAAYDKIHRIGFPITLKYAPGIWKTNARSGMKEGKRFLLLKRYEVVKTKDGSVTVRWTETNTAGPDGRTYDNNYIFRKLRILNENDIEEALFLIGINPVVKTGRILVVEDVAADAKEIADRRAGETDVSYLLYSKFSPVSQDRIIKMAHAWGVTGIEAMKGSMDAIKNALFDRVKLKEQAHDQNFGYSAFIDAAMADDTPEFVECMALVADAERRGVIAYNSREFCWVVKGASKQDDTLLLSINPAQSDRKNELLALDIMGNQRRKKMLSAEPQQFVEPPSFDLTPKVVRFEDIQEDDEDDEDTSQQKKKIRKEAMEKFAQFTKAQWGKCAKSDFELACKLADLNPNTPVGVLISKLDKFYRDYAVSNS